jgi:hypothetical protein
MPVRHFKLTKIKEVKITQLMMDKLKLVVKLNQEFLKLLDPLLWVITMIHIVHQSGEDPV